MIYVDADATGANDGSSWAGAFVFLQDALAFARPGDEVWVAEGIYRPDLGAGITAGDRETSFVVPPGISLYGGFSGKSSDPSSRDWLLQPTILSGDLNQDDTAEVDPLGPSRTDNSENVLQIRDPASTVILDGLTVSGGNNTCSGVSNASGVWIQGALDTVYLRNVSITDNSSCGPSLRVVYGENSEDVDVMFDELTFANNVSTSGSSLIQIEYANVHIHNSTVRDNEAGLNLIWLFDQGQLAIIRSEIVANYHQRAIIRSDKSAGFVAIINSRIIGNIGLSTYTVGGLWALGGQIEIINTVFAGNSANGWSGAVYIEDTAHARISNSGILFNRTHSSSGAGGLAFDGLSVGSASLLVGNVILWHNDAPVHTNIVAPRGGRDRPSGIHILSSVADDPVPESYFETGMIEGIDNPLFRNVDGADGSPGTFDDDYRLLAASPLIDRGTISALPPDGFDIDNDGDVTEDMPFDLALADRVAGNGVDIGPFEYQYEDTSSEAYYARHLLRSRSQYLIVYPNPARPGESLTITSLGHDRLVDLALFDSEGRIVFPAYNGLLTAGASVTVLMPNLASGRYALVDRSRPASNLIFIVR